MSLTKALFGVGFAVASAINAEMGEVGLAVFCGLAAICMWLIGVAEQCGEKP